MARPLLVGRAYPREEGSDYVGYPTWAFWLGRHLLQLVRESVTGQRA